MPPSKIPYHIIPGEKVDPSEVIDHTIRCPAGHIYQSWDKDSKICRECRNKKKSEYHRLVGGRIIAKKLD